MDKEFFAEFVCFSPLASCMHNMKPNHCFWLVGCFVCKTTPNYILFGARCLPECFMEFLYRVIFIISFTLILDPVGLP